jgi:hypothetical protein
MPQGVKIDLILKKGIFCFISLFLYVDLWSGTK